MLCFFVQKLNRNTCCETDDRASVEHVVQIQRLVLLFLVLLFLVLLERLYQVIRRQPVFVESALVKRVLFVGLQVVSDHVKEVLLEVAQDDLNQVVFSCLVDAFNVLRIRFERDVD